MKSVDEIRFLLGKFYEGETSLAEEQLLADFFATCSDIPEDLKADRALFVELVSAESEDLGNVAVPEGLVEELAAVIDREAGKERHSGQRWWTWQRVAGIAASVCLFVSVGIYILNQPVSTEMYAGKNVYVPQTEEEAIAVTSKALMLMAEKVNVANERMALASSRLEEINENQYN